MKKYKIHFDNYYCGESQRFYVEARNMIHAKDIWRSYYPRCGKFRYIYIEEYAEPLFISKKMGELIEGES